jgi:hypothetical protein
MVYLWCFQEFNVITAFKLRYSSGYHIIDAQDYSAGSRRSRLTRLCTYNWLDQEQTKPQNIQGFIGDLCRTLELLRLQIQPIVWWYRYCMPHSRLQPARGYDSYLIGYEIIITCPVSSAILATQCFELRLWTLALWRAPWILFISCERVTLVSMFSACTQPATRRAGEFLFAHLHDNLFIAAR